MNLRSLTFVFNLTLKEEEYHKELLEPIESDYQSMTSQVRKRKTSPQAKGKQLTLQKVKGRKFCKSHVLDSLNDYFFHFFGPGNFKDFEFIFIIHNNYVFLALCCQVLLIMIREFREISIWGEGVATFYYILPSHTSEYQWRYLWSITLCIQIGQGI